MAQGQCPGTEEISVILM